MKTSFTPGPWTIRNANENDPQKHLRLLGAEKEDGWQTVIGQIRTDLLADANLIVVAPEMFEALDGLVNEIIEFFDYLNKESAYKDLFNERCKAAKVILKKARGEK